MADKLPQLLRMARRMLRVFFFSMSIRKKFVFHLLVSELLDILCGDTVSAFMLWVPFSKLPRTWLVQLLAGMLFFHSDNQPIIQKKLQEKVEWGDQVYKDDDIAY